MQSHLTNVLEIPASNLQHLSEHVHNLSLVKDLNAQKAKAAADEDFELALSLKKLITAKETRLMTLDEIKSLFYGAPVMTQRNLINEMITTCPKFA